MIGYFSNVSLAQLSKEDKENILIQLHNLGLDISKHEASSRGGSKTFYNILIKTYSNRMESILEVSQQSSAEVFESKIEVVRQKERKSASNGGIYFRTDIFMKIYAITYIVEGKMMCCFGFYPSPNG